MPNTTNRPAALAATLLSALLAVLLTGCGQQSADADPARPHDRPAGATGSADTTPAQDSRIDTDAVFFRSGAGPAPDVQQVIENREQLTAFARRLGTRGEGITVRAARTDYSHDVLVGWSVTTGCADWPSATLHRTGDALRPVPGPHRAPPPECLVAHHAVAVFAVPRDRMPDHPRFAH
ncbi:hypothetical protein ACZ90_12845 [Streptomyces albus subsp. albus]|nr:hypothetical protein ACZ90_12845 [Streptomyces albus subsp. albus]